MAYIIILHENSGYKQYDFINSKMLKPIKRKIIKGSTLKY